jgi:hypothetical protein
MQSVTWEAVRTLFKNKSAPMQRAARDVWKRYAVGELTHPQAVDEIIKLNKGFDRPVWGDVAGKGLAKPKVGSYQRAEDVTPETPALPRVKPQRSSDDEYARGGMTPVHPAMNIPGVHIRTAEAGDPIFHGDE